MSKAVACLLLAGSLALGGADAAPGAERWPLSAELLLARARDYGLQRRGKQTPADITHVRALLRGAARLDPQAPEPLFLLYELAMLQGAADAASEYLGQLVELQPENLSAFAQWLDVGPRNAQTLEQRRAWLEGRLAAPRPAALAALIHTRLGEIDLLRLDITSASEQLEQALRLCSACPDSSRLELAALGAHSPPERRVAALLRGLALAPADGGLAWETGATLDRLGLAAEARPFFEHAIRLGRLAAPDAELTADQHLQLSKNALARRDSQAGLAHAQEAVRLGAGELEPAFYALWFSRRFGATQAADEIQKNLSRAFAAMRDLEVARRGPLIYGAWFYSYVEPDAPRALAFAEVARRRFPDDPLGQRARGWALALSGQVDAAIEALAPVSRTDAFAAYQLAKLRLERGDRDGAADALRELEDTPRVGPARELLDQLEGIATASAPAAERFPAVKAAVDAFDGRPLEFPFEPARFVQAEIVPVHPSFAVAEPWQVEFRIVSKADFPITLGPQWMLNPTLLVSFQVEADRKRLYPNLFNVHLDAARVIPPRGAVSVRKRLDVGPLSALNRQMPERLLRVTVAAILDPAQASSGAWGPSATGQLVRPTPFNRLPITASNEYWHYLFAELGGESRRERFAALEIMGRMLGADQRARRSDAEHRSRTPASRLAGALRLALDSEDAETRAHALDALQLAGLDAASVAAAEANLQHPHWLVRLLATRLLARQGDSFLAAAAQVAADDSDELVRDLARSYVERSGSADSQPGETARDER